MTKQKLSYFENLGPEVQAFVKFAVDSVRPYKAGTSKKRDAEIAVEAKERAEARSVVPQGDFTWGAKRPATSTPKHPRRRSFLGIHLRKEGMDYRQGWNVTWIRGRSIEITRKRFREPTLSDAYPSFGPVAELRGYRVRVYPSFKVFKRDESFDAVDAALARNDCYLITRDELIDAKESMGASAHILPELRDAGGEIE